ncbi:MAG: hypothetical protein N4A62_14480 [Marinisporobacter sp.]|jgi:hypothetical protein|nr:hypothetical protein [Marinisporobacter sp.]
MKTKTVNTVEERFRSAGVKIKRLTTVEEIKNNSWVMPTTDRKGMIRVETKRIAMSKVARA